MFDLAWDSVSRNVCKRMFSDVSACPHLLEYLIQQCQTSYRVSDFKSLGWMV